jgi:hypothetical protein
MWRCGGEWRGGVIQPRQASNSQLEAPRSASLRDSLARFMQTFLSELAHILKISDGQSCLIMS